MRTNCLKLRLKSFVVSFFVFAVAITAPQFSFAATTAATGSSTPDVLIVTPRDGHAPFTDAIDAAKKQVSMVMFHLSEKSVIASLKAAGTRGVETKVILDREIAAKSASAPGIIADLKAAGVQVELSSPAFSITHEKSMLIDGKTLFITSMNMTTIFSRTRDFGIVTAEKTAIDEYKTFFDTDWSNAQTGAGVTPPDSTDLVWSPTSSTAKLTALIASAKKTVDIMVENLGSADIQAALSAAAKSGVTIRLLVPACIEGTAPNRNEPYLDQLMADGVDARVMAGTPSTAIPYTHAKMMVVDKHKFYLGSENFSFNSLTKAREVGLVRDNAGLAKEISAIFDGDFGAASVRKNAQVWSCSGHVF
ncbi:hypothetical protein BH10BDE1_BH10BDE1_34780 [soil metagenome]